VRIALLSRQSVRNVDRARNEILQQFTPILKNLKLSKKSPLLMQSILQNLENAPDFQALIQATRASLMDLKTWYRNNINEHSERDFAVNNALDISSQIMTPALLAHKQIQNLSYSSENLFECHALYERARNPQPQNIPAIHSLPLDENGLFESP
jgi:hypothetical protein